MACTQQRLLWARLPRLLRHVITLQPSTAAGDAVPGHPWVPWAGLTPGRRLSLLARCSEELRRLSLWRGAFKLRGLLRTV